MKRRHFLYIAGCLGLSGLAESRRIQPAFAGIESPFNPEKIVMQLDWKYNVQFAGVLLADYYDLYQKQGLAVEIRPGKPGVSATDRVVADPRTIACAEQDVILKAQASGKPIVAIAAMFQNSPLGLMSMPDRHIRRLRDLIGGRVGMHGATAEVMKWAMDCSHIEPGQIEIVPVSEDEKYDRLRSGDLDAVQCYAVDEPIGFAARTGIAPDVLKFGDYGYDTYVQVIFAHEKLLETEPETVRRFLQATFSGWKMAFQDRIEAAKIIVDYYAEPGGKYHNLDYQIRSLERVEPYVLGDLNPDDLGEIDGDRWQSVADQLAAYHIIDRIPALSKSLNRSFL
ncbi:ABC transporter substrate-binding protein [Lyngbya sp. CCY1209]|uniref:ABC transporter substrate-binding protein n=1 Tax=Lyngbya sp. CCY1209 TaxID=2886103 RepID=UPI002D211BBD|nr:ABC transporter substrate-binding protein [Lyngbya sp. CCY1209]MEB3887154.1 ABC transporter substrate-binding protein [Lyngbya sp. CCY1209]